MSASDASSAGTAAGEPDDSEEGPGILGSLPRSRPAVRSPRRARATTGAGSPSTDSGGSSSGDAGQPAATDPKAETTPEGREADVEALARAGISLAGEAATLGLRLAGRAAAALRDATERR